MIIVMLIILIIQITLGYVIFRGFDVVHQKLSVLEQHAAFYGSEILPTLNQNRQVLPEMLRLRSEFNALAHHVVAKKATPKRKKK